MFEFEFELTFFSDFERLEFFAVRTFRVFQKFENQFLE